MLHLLAVVSLAADPPRIPVQDRLEVALERVEATPAQRSAAHDRVDAAMSEAADLRERAAALRVRVHDALFGPVVDRAALEAARADLLALVDEGSALAFDVAADLADLFTPAQREELRQLREETLRDRVARWWRG